MTEDERFQKWALIIAKALIQNQDKTFRQLVDKQIIPSWTDFFLVKIEQAIREINSALPPDPFDLLAGIGGLMDPKKRHLIYGSWS